jgi:DNA-binding transcriptional regulator LsrR (DeoR family)
MDPQIEIEIAASLKEILKWIRVQAMPSAKSTLESTLSDTTHRKIYQALDGSVTQMQLAKTFKLSQPTISRLITAWQRVGIVEEASPGRYLKTFDLKGLGIEEGVIED